VPPPGGFLQATPEGEAALVAAIRDMTRGAGRVLDLFAGCGTFSLPLAETAEVHAVEGLAAPLQALDAAARRTPGLRRITTETRDLSRRPLLPDELAYDAIVIDPPRAGAEAQAGQIALSGVEKLAWVSCDPVTFARDARVLADAGYDIARLFVIDQFRWSPHVETVAEIRRR
jgi:23S rRNA (uracil1939-C5)-methyltransferase